MFNRIIKWGNHKVPKSNASEPAVYPYGAATVGGAPVVCVSNMIVNHASRTTLSSFVPGGTPGGAPPNSHPQASSGPAAATAQIEAVPLFRDVPIFERQALFLCKFQIYAVALDFSDTLKSACEKEAKCQTLIELVDFIQSGSGRIIELVQE